MLDIGVHGELHHSLLHIQMCYVLARRLRATVANMGGFSSSREYSLSYGRWEYGWWLRNFQLPPIVGYVVYALCDPMTCYCISWNICQAQPDLAALEPPRVYVSETSTDSVLTVFDEDAVTSSDRDSDWCS